MKRSNKIEYHFSGIFRERVVAPVGEALKIYGRNCLLIFYPRTTQELQLITQYANKHKILLVQSTGQVKVLPDKDFFLIDFSRMNKMEWNSKDHYISVDVGTSVGEFLSFLKKQGYFLPGLSTPQMDSLSIFSVVNDLSLTGSTSHLFGPLSSAIVGFEGVLGSGEMISVSSGAGTYIGSLEVMKELFLDYFGRYGLLSRLVFKPLPTPAAKGMFCIEVRDLAVGYYVMEALQKNSPCLLECYFFDKETLEILSQDSGSSLLKSETSYLIVLELFSTSPEELSRLMNRTQVSLADVLEDIVFIEHTQSEEEIKKKLTLKNFIELSVSQKSYDFRRECFFLLPSEIPIFIQDCENIKRDFGIDFLFSGSLEHGFLDVYILNIEDEGGFIWNTFQHEIRAKLLDILFVHKGRPIFYSRNESETIEKFFAGNFVVSMMDRLQNICDPNHILISTHGGV